MKKNNVGSVFLLTSLLLTSVAHADIIDSLSDKIGRELGSLAIFKQGTKSENLKFSGIAESNGVSHHITIVDSGVGALKKRLDMIESATKSIDVQYFIYSIDKAGRLFTQALIRKAQQGVKVRVIIDTSKAVFELNKMFVDEMVRQGGKDAQGNSNITVKYYNVDSYIDLISLNFRSHKKVIIVDNKIAVTGGRNMADEYFGLSEKYNFLDVDVFVENNSADSIIPKITLDFEDFWNSPIVSLPKKPTPPKMAQNTEENIVDETQYKLAVEKFNKELDQAHDYTVENDSDRALLKSVQSQGELALKNLSFDGECKNLVYAADHPGIGKRDGTRVLAPALLNEVDLATQSSVLDANAAAPGEMIIESPYFIPNDIFTAMVNELEKEKVQLKILTNSLNSTDAFYTIAAFDQKVQPLLRKGVGINIYDGSSEANKLTAFPDSQKARWGTHAKRAVIGNTVMIGTFNIDPRSNNLNAEMAVICRDSAEAAKWTVNSIKSREEHSVALDVNGKPIDGRPIHFGASYFNKLEYWVSYPFAKFLNFLL